MQRGNQHGSHEYGDLQIDLIQRHMKTLYIIKDRGKSTVSQSY